MCIKTTDETGNTDRKCSKCRDVKPISQFHSNNKKKGTYNYICKNCYNDYQYKLKYGIIKPRVISEVVDGKRVCKVCDELKTLDQYQKRNTKSGFTSTCGRCMYEKIKSRRTPKEIKLTKEGYKFCNGCKKEKTIDNFTKLSSSKSGLIYRCRECKAEQQREYSKNNISVKIRNRINVALNIYKKQGFNIKKSSNTFKLLGCDLTYYTEYLESLFKEGMNWKNHGNKDECWHIDHIIPLSKFDLTKEDEQYIAFNYKNTQPLWKYENLSKSSKIL